jgi:replication initiation and membrane attachment protein DnaB
MNEEDWNKNIQIIDEVIKRNLLPEDVVNVIAQLVILGDNDKGNRDCIWISIRELSHGILHNGEEE